MILNSSDKQVVVNKDPITLEKLKEASLVIFPGPRDLFSADEFTAITEFLNSKGNVLFLVSEGGEKKLATNVNYLFEEYGIAVNPDAVIRTSYYKYFHPKVCVIANNMIVLNRKCSSVRGCYVKTCFGFPKD
eukprot:GHVL01040925.1.p1 GENE.GHVL01040925.1~~GHVL01040925.1.p1  ORF type:complete len:132 (+),score=10.28 GHVL01040925.1:223-618(+)